MHLSSPYANSPLVNDALYVLAIEFTLPFLECLMAAYLDIMYKYIFMHNLVTTFLLVIYFKKVVGMGLGFN